MPFRFAVVALIAASSLPGAEAILRGRVLDQDTGQVMPATVAIRTAAGQIIADHPSYRGGFRTPGAFEKRLAPGRVSITASRGFDYGATMQEIELRDGETRDIEFRLKRRTPVRALGWHAGDNHVHMAHGERTIEVTFDYMALAARAEGLDYLSATNHWNLDPHPPEALDEACRRLSSDGFLLTWNLEAPKNYWRGNAGQCVGHGWTLGMRGRAADGSDAIQELLGMSAWDYESEKTPIPNFEMHALIHRQGGIVSYTHPHRWWWGKWGGKGGYPVQEKMRISNMAAELPFDTVAGPTYDTIDIMMQPEERETNRRALGLWYLLLNHGYRMAATASSDTTFDNPGGGVPGKVRTYTRLEGAATPASLAAAMKAGRNFVTSGPLLLLEIGGKQPGDVLPATAGRKLAARIRAWPSGAVGERLTRVELIRNGDVVRTWTPEGPAVEEFSDRQEVEEPGNAWYIARCFGSKDTQVAVTNPVYFEAPEYRAPTPATAHVRGTVSDGAGKPLDGTVAMVAMDGRKAVRIGRVMRVTGGRFEADVPATARLEVTAAGYESQSKSVFMDSPALLDATLNMTADQLSDWGTFEAVRRNLREVKLEFRLQRVRSGRRAAM